MKHKNLEFMVIGKGKFTRINFDEQSVTFKYKFVKFGRIRENAIRNISNDLKETFYGLERCEVIMNDGEITVVLYLSKEAAKIFYDTHPKEKFETDEVPFMLDLEEQTQGLNNLIKYNL